MDVIIAMLMTIAGLAPMSAEVTETADAKVMCPSPVEDAGKYIVIPRGQGYSGYATDKGIFTLSEDHDNRERLYFKATAPGKDTIVITYTDEQGSRFMQYIVRADEDLDAEILECTMLYE